MGSCARRYNARAIAKHPAGMAELVDAADSKSAGGNTMWVRFPLPAPKHVRTPTQPLPQPRTPRLPPRRVYRMGRRRGTAHRGVRARPDPEQPRFRRGRGVSRQARLPRGVHGRGRPRRQRPVRAQGGLRVRAVSVRRGGAPRQGDRGAAPDFSPAPPPGGERGTADRLDRYLDGRLDRDDARREIQLADPAAGAERRRPPDLVVRAGSPEAHLDRSGCALREPEGGRAAPSGDLRVVRSAEGRAVAPGRRARLAPGRGRGVPARLRPGDHERAVRKQRRCRIRQRFHVRRRLVADLGRGRVSDPRAARRRVRSIAGIHRQADAGARAARETRRIRGNRPCALADEHRPDRNGGGFRPRHRTQNVVRICVVGAGAIGGLVASGFARAGNEVSLIARGAHLEALRANGLTVLSGDKREVFRLRASDDPSELGAQDAVFICLKTHSIAAMLPRTKPLLGRDTTVVPAINGLPWWYFYKEGGRFDGQTVACLDPEGTLFQALAPRHILGCVVHAAAEVAEPGVVRHTAGRVFLIGEPDRTRSARAERLVAAMNAAGFEARQAEDIRGEIWVKLIGNLSYNPVAALALAHMNDIHGSEGLLALIRKMMEEAMRVAEGYGVRIPMTIDQRIDIARQLAGAKISMHQDIEKRRPLETDAIIGAVVELARKAGIATPMIDAVYALIAERAKHLDR